MSRSILLTGGSGFVSGSVIRQAPADVALHVISRGPALVSRPGLHWHRIDPLSEPELHGVFETARPSAVIHTAALAGIDYCEANREETYAVNVTFTERLAGLCAGAGARLVYTSTDNAFDGERGRYTEDDPPAPVNYYGETKVAAERAAASMGSGWVAARVALVMGLPMLGVGNSFLSRMVPVLERGETLGVPEGEVRSPIDVVTLGAALLELTGHSYSGLLHLSGNDVGNRCALVRRMAARLGHDPGLVIPADPVDLPGRAPRPRDVSLDNTRARGLLRTALCGIEEGVARISAWQRLGEDSPG